MTILQDIKTGIGIDPNNLGFDQELLLLINGYSAVMAQNGVLEFSGLIIDENTEWPEFVHPLVRSMAKPLMIMKVRSVFDPIPSETIRTSMEKATVEYEGRIQLEIDGEEPNG